MSIVVYQGLQGSGKTYEVVESVILPAVLKGRRIVTNIRGLDVDAIKAYCEAEHKTVVEPRIQVVTNAEIDSDDFLYYERETRHGPVKPDNTIVKPGDLVIVDEVWRFWDTGCKVRENHQIFFRMHRQFDAAESGDTCDLVLVTQDIGDLHRSVRRVVERNFRMAKMTELGADSRYTVFMFDRDKSMQRAMQRKWLKKYDPKVYALYKSYANAQGQESAVDARRSFFHGPQFARRVATVVVLMLLGIWGVYSFFFASTDEPSQAAAKKKADVSKSAKASKGDASKGGSKGLVSSLVGESGAAVVEWRQVGHMEMGGVLTVLVRTSDGRYRWLRNPDFTQDGRELTVVVDGQPVTTWSGSSNAPAAKGGKR